MRNFFCFLFWVIFFPSLERSPFHTNTHKHPFVGYGFESALARPSNPNYLWIVSRQYYFKWSSSLSSPLVSLYAFEGLQLPKPPQRCWTAQEKKEGGNKRVASLSFFVLPAFIKKLGDRPTQIHGSQRTRSFISLLLCYSTSENQKGRSFLLPHKFLSQPPTHPY